MSYHLRRHSVSLQKSQRRGTRPKENATSTWLEKRDHSARCHWDTIRLQNSSDPIPFLPQCGTDWTWPVDTLVVKKQCITRPDKSFLLLSAIPVKRFGLLWNYYYNKEETEFFFSSFTPIWDKNQDSIYLSELPKAFLQFPDKYELLLKEEWWTSSCPNLLPSNSKWTFYPFLWTTLNVLYVFYVMFRMK